MEGEQVKEMPTSFKAVLDKVRTAGIMDNSQISALAIISEEEYEALKIDERVGKVRLLLQDNGNHYSAINDGKEVNEYPAVYVEMIKKASCAFLGRKTEFVYYWMLNAPLIIIAHGDSSGTNLLVGMVAPRIKAD